MGLVALIVRRQPLRISDWLACIDGHSNLVRGVPREVENPFTGKPTVLQPNPAEVSIYREDEEIGAIEPDPAFEHTGELLVYAGEGMEEAVREIALDVAAQLGGELQWIPPDEPR